MRPLKPVVEPALAQSWAREIYGLDARASALPGEIDRNFLLHVPGGARCVLKIAPVGGNRVEIEGQLAVLDALQSGDLGGFVPRVQRDLNGDALREVQSEDGQRHLLRMVSFIEGTPLAASRPAGPVLLREIGRLLGRLDRELESFAHPGTQREIVWDSARLLELRPLLDAVSPGTRPFVAAGLERFARRVEPRLDDLPRSVIHNDANDYNLLIDQDAGLCGLIDFGDVVHSITVAELAIACAYAMLDTEDPQAVARDVTAGYEQARPLTSLERELLADLIVGRLCASLLMSAQARLDSPEDEYLTISERPAAELLERLEA